LKKLLTPIITLSLLTGGLFYLDYGTQTGSPTAMQVAKLFNNNYEFNDTLQASISNQSQFKTFSPSITPDHLHLANFKASSITPSRFSQTFLTHINKTSKLNSIHSYQILSNDKPIIKVFEIPSKNSNEAKTQFETLQISALTQSQVIAKIDEHTFHLMNENNAYKYTAFQNKNSVYGLEYEKSYEPQVKTLIQTLKAL
jgi:hypothetical protein